MKRKLVVITSIGLLLAVVLVVSTYSSKSLGTIKGHVYDHQGIPLPAVQVTAINSVTGVKNHTSSDRHGYFIFSNLPLGSYEVKAEKPGFRSKVQHRILSAVKDPVIVMFKLKSLPILKEEEGKADKRFLSGLVAGVQSPSSRQRPFEASFPAAYYTPFNTEEYDRIYENTFLAALKNPLSTFSIDVDTASYSNIRRFILNSQFPYKDAVRVEEMINYFTYDYPLPTGKHPFSIYTEMASCPWNAEHRLIHIGLQGKKPARKNLPASNLVFLLDVSGSMRAPNKLALLKKAFRLLVNELSEKDRVAIVVYAGAAGLVLPSTPAGEKETIISAIEKLRAGGSTAGGAGIKLAYKTAAEHFIAEGNNRVILATDGDFNVGVSSTSELVRMIEEKRKQGIFLTVLGFGMGNYKDGRMEQLADKGNGNYFYIDNLLEAKKVFVHDMRGTLFTIAKDVKIQVEFNPAKVKAYRLIGYENRLLKKEDFADDTKDAGELGAGHTVTALYEILPYGAKQDVPELEDLKYQVTRISPRAFKTKEVLTVKLRYKAPDGKRSRLIEMPLEENIAALAKASESFKFSAAVASFGMMLRESQFKGATTYENILKLARESQGTDSYGYRAEFIRLVEMCQALSSSQDN